MQNNIIQINSWALQIAAIFAFAMILNIFVGFILKNAEKAAKKTKSMWDDSLLEAAVKPIYVFIWIAAIKLAVDILLNNFHGISNLKTSNIALKIAIVAIIGWFLTRVINIISNKYIEKGTIGKKEADHTTIDAISKLLKIIVFVITVLLILQNFGLSISGILAAGGIGGIAIGFAAQDLLANFFGGITIYTDKPFKVGDWIRCSEKNIEGVVEFIGWRHTRIRSFSKNPIYVPNAIFTNAVVENPSRMTNRRINETIGLRYMDMKKISNVTKKVQEYIDNHEKIDHEQNNIINFTAFSASTLDLSLMAFTKITDIIEFKILKQEIMLKIAEIVEEEGADMAFETRTLYIEKSEE